MGSMASGGIRQTMPSPAGDGGTILHYDGKTWYLVNSGTIENLKGIWGSSGGNVFAVGNGGAILHYSGPNKIFLPLILKK